jgi:hypothetical protein
MYIPLESDLVVGGNVASSVSPLGELGLGDIVGDISTKKNSILSVERVTKNV